MPDEARPGPISLRLPADLLEKLDKIAAALDRPRSWVLIHAFKEYLRHEGEEIIETQEGIEQIERGASVSSEELFAELDEIIAKAKADRA
jgi:predicted transcriptional regulator